MNTQTRWAQLRPDDFIQRRNACPVVLLPIGLCEPHGHIAPLGLDTLKADYYCDEAAKRAGGIVAPTQGYHIHECGFHAPWLEAVVGETNPMLGGMPPQAICYHFLYQLRAFANAGFRAILVVSGHSGGSQKDLRTVGAAFTQKFNIPVMIKTDPEWTGGQYDGDHAGKYEISQLLDILPQSIDMGLLNRQFETDSGGQLALNEDAHEATAEHGKVINDTIVQAIVEQIESFRDSLAELPASDPNITYDTIEGLWKRILVGQHHWHSSRPAPDQPKVDENSRWKPYERHLFASL